MTEIQAKSIPVALQGKDLLASSKTGSGKTLAFLVPAMQRMLRNKALSRKDPRTLILAPTRELAKQVFLQVKWLIANQPLSATLILGGENFNDQVKALRRNPQIVVGTAGRIADHLNDKSLYLNGLELLIFDEADRMLDLGFAEQLRMINRFADHRKRQTMMFSATLDNPYINSLTQDILKAPQRISVGAANELHSEISQRFILADHIEHKEKLLTSLLGSEDYQQVIIFTATRADTQRLSDWLNSEGHHSAALSADLNQGQRSNIMNEFSRGQHQILITTDVASRGLDLRKVSLVINFDLPRLADEYIHRIGRTGRAGDEGHAISLVGPKDWTSFVAISRMFRQTFSFTAIEGLEAEFKGFRVNKPGKGKTKAKSGAKKSNQKVAVKRPAKRIRTTEGKDIGDAPMIRRKKPVAE